ncbi:D-glucuronyl C5-epimerase B isoform X2 [Aphidius gifuensis]|uniref:D-glucuronyl C5-epimerase B isoform X2 n=1 Tax=Aphidius gifuensis TaxID=684658 RepID=UPI001CDCCC36|nr:D-glucuronyl C5-epimerase B isoform X2 [Aphidius gifuensis]
MPYNMMRINFKTILLILMVAVASSILTYWGNCTRLLFVNKPEVQLQQKEQHLVNIEPTYQDIDCNINGGYLISCRKEGDEVYIPFSFIHKYFEIYGKLATYDGVERFEWLHSYSKILSPKSKYDSRGVFMTFENYNVEIRERVKCITGYDGVPMSTQWETQGYYYPTQIAQFGLSHYSKNLTEPEPHRKIIEDAENLKKNWQISQGSTLTRTFDEYKNTYIYEFTTPELSKQGIYLQLNHILSFVIKFDLYIIDNTTITIVLQNREKKDLYYLHYSTIDTVLSTNNNHIYYGIGKRKNTWHRLTRDLIIDLQKGININDNTNKVKKIKLTKLKLKIIKIILIGNGKIDNITLSTSEHIEQFYDSARWFVNNQNKTTGGWSNNVKRKLAIGMNILEPGWYSGMGQGHALSVLSRAYYHSGDDNYLIAAINGLKPFKTLSENGGVLAKFLDKFIWYEEYPTQPASFILNGFIYALIGLYDLKTIAHGYDDANDAGKLFDDGMISLKNMLTLFDTGYRTTYDLRHFTLKIAPNIARWDYHATHINQLLLINTIDDDPIFSLTAERWIGYMNGKRAAHN